MADRSSFVDTGYLVALINRRDALHGQATALARAWAKDGRILLTTDGVLIEFANFFARSPLRSLAITSIRQIRSTQGWTVLRLVPTLVDRAEARYGAHMDKAWSLTDCLSMEAMLDHGIREAATPDHHFEQAGFRILMRA
ncbi:MAG TPA: PIN domain-containing protein [Polyangiales bacterium]